MVYRIIIWQIKKNFSTQNLTDWRNEQKDDQIGRKSPILSAVWCSYYDVFDCWVRMSRPADLKPDRLSFVWLKENDLTWWRGCSSWPSWWRSWCPEGRRHSVMSRPSTGPSREWPTSQLTTSSPWQHSWASHLPPPRLVTWGSCPPWLSPRGRRPCWRTSSPPCVPSSCPSWPTGRPRSPGCLLAAWPRSGGVWAGCRISLRTVCIWMFTLLPQVSLSSLN